MSYASVLVLFLMIVSLLMDWKQIYIDGWDSRMMIILNKGFVTSVVALASLTLTLSLLRNEKQDSLLNRNEYRISLAIIAVVFLYFANLLELRHQVNFYVEPFATRELIIGLYNMFFVLLLLVAGEKLPIPDSLKKLVPVWGVIAMLAYVFHYHDVSITARNNYLEGVSSFTGFMFHYAVLIFLVSIMVLSLRKIGAQKAFVENIRHVHWWFFIVLFVFLASAELDHIVVLIANDPQLTASYTEHNHRIGFPILWGVTSFVLIALGLKRKVKMLRVISLVLMLVTLLKLFIVDLRDISEGGKIAAFISLGVLLLIVSFMYQRLKKLLLEDTVVESEEKL